MPLLWNKLTASAQSVIDKQGVAYIDRDGDLAISIVNGAECVFATKGEDGIWSCRIEQLFNEGKISFRKPISCHLYPVRTKKFADFTAVNYHTWPVCKDAVSDGNAKNLLLYKFLKEPLIRKFGTEWYNQLSLAAHQMYEK